MTQINKCGIKFIGNNRPNKIIKFFADANAQFYGLYRRAQDLLCRRFKCKKTNRHLNCFLIINFLLIYFVTQFDLTAKREDKYYLEKIEILRICIQTTSPEEGN